MKKMDSSKKKIIKILLNQNDWCSAKKLSSDLDVSVRTIKSYVLEINNENSNLILSSNKGYRINRDKDVDKILSYNESLPIVPGHL